MALGGRPRPELNYFGVSGWHTCNEERCANPKRGAGRAIGSPCFLHILMIVMVVGEPETCFHAAGRGTCRPVIAHSYSHPRPPRCFCFFASLAENKSNLKKSSPASIVALLDVKKASNIEITLSRLTREGGKEPEEIVECINHLDARALAETSGKQ